MILGKYLVKKANSIYVFSDFEKNEINKIMSGNNLKFKKIIWGINATTFNKTNFFDQFKTYDESVVITYWGRIDYYVKGIDRIFEAVIYLREEIQKIGFEIFLIGPDYNNGYELVKTEIKKYDLGKIIHLLTPDDYIPGDKQPLIDSDVSIYLSKWDGFPRTLRESVNYKIPLLVSEETNFSDLVRKYNIGLSIPSAYKVEELAHALNYISQKNNLEKINKQYNSIYAKIMDELNYKNILKSFIEDIYE